MGMCDACCVYMHSKFCPCDCSDKDRGEWADSLSAAHQGEPLEVGAGQRTPGVQERQA